MGVKLQALADVTVAVTGTPQPLLAPPYPQNVVGVRIAPIAGVLYVGGPELDQGAGITGIKLDAAATAGPQAIELGVAENSMNIDAIYIEGTATNKVAVAVYIKTS